MAWGLAGKKIVFFGRPKNSGTAPQKTDEIAETSARFVCYIRSMGYTLSGGDCQEIGLVELHLHKTVCPSFVKGDRSAGSAKAYGAPPSLFFQFAARQRKNSEMPSRRRLRLHLHYIAVMRFRRALLSSIPYLQIDICLARTGDSFVNILHKFIRDGYKITAAAHYARPRSVFRRVWSAHAL